MTTFFTSTGARQGDVILAVNTLLMQLFTLFSYIMDGFAYAGEALSGRYVGACNLVQLKRAVKALFGWGVGLSLVFTLLYGIGGENFLGLFLLGACYSASGICCLSVGWNSDRGHGYPFYVMGHAGGFR